MDQLQRGHQIIPEPVGHATNGGRLAGDDFPGLREQGWS
jgi:hypothetical protein